MFNIKNIIITALYVVLFFASCKKDKENTQTSCQPTHIHYLTAASEIDVEIKRNAAGQIVQRTMTTKRIATGALARTVVDSFIYSNASQIIQTSTTSNPNTTVTSVMTTSAVLNAEGYVTSINSISNNSTVTFSATYTYDSNGYLSTEQNSTSAGIFTYSYLNGNLISLANGSGELTTFEYDLNIPDKTFWELVDPFKKGKKSANFVKKETYTSPGYSSVTNYAYTSLNAAGYPLRMTLNRESTLGTDPLPSENIVYDLQYICQ